MKIFLPPSEKKNEPKQKTALKLNALSFNADLTTTRTAVLKKHKIAVDSKKDLELSKS